MSCRTSSTAVIKPGARPLGYAFLFFVVSFFTIPFLIGFILFPFFGLYFLYNIIHCGNHWIQVTPSKIDIHYAVCTVTIPRSEFVRASLRETGFRNLSVLTLQTVSGKYHFGLVDHYQSPPEVSVHSRENCFPALPRLSGRGSTHTVMARWTALWERLVGKPRGKATDPLIHAKGSMTLLL